MCLVLAVVLCSYQPDPYGQMDNGARILSWCSVFSTRSPCYDVTVVQGLSREKTGRGLIVRRACKERMLDTTHGRACLAHTSQPLLGMQLPLRRNARCERDLCSQGEWLFCSSSPSPPSSALCFLRRTNCTNADTAVRTCDVAHLKHPSHHSSSYTRRQYRQLAGTSAGYATVNDALPEECAARCSRDLACKSFEHRGATAAQGQECTLTYDTPETRLDPLVRVDDADDAVFDKLELSSVFCRDKGQTSFASSESAAAGSFPTP